MIYIYFRKASFYSNHSEENKCATASPYPTPSHNFALLPFLIIPALQPHFDTLPQISTSAHAPPRVLLSVSAQTYPRFRLPLRLPPLCPSSSPHSLSQPLTNQCLILKSCLLQQEKGLQWRVSTRPIISSLSLSPWSISGKSSSAAEGCSDQI